MMKAMLIMTSSIVSSLEDLMPLEWTVSIAFSQNLINQVVDLFNAKTLELLTLFLPTQELYLDKSPKMKLSESSLHASQTETTMDVSAIPNSVTTTQLSLCLSTTTATSINS